MVRAFVNRPLVVTVHGNADVYELPRAMAPLTRAVLKRADVVVSVSQDLGDHLQNKMGVPNVTVIPERHRRRRHSTRAALRDGRSRCSRFPGWCRARTSTS